MDPLVLTLTIISAVVAICLIVLGIQAFLVLREAQKTLQRVNTILDVVQNTAVRALVPLSNMGGFLTGVKSGLKVFETFVRFLHKNTDEDYE